MKWLFPLLVFLYGASGTAEETRLLRFPAIHGDQVVFTYAGDLYTVAATGGVARKLTSDIGFELFARFSPDGKNLAFTGQYDGNTEVYLMSAEGGVPRRLTYTATLSRDDVGDRMGPNNIVMGWDGNDRIIYRSRAIEWNDWKGQLFTVSVNGGLSEQLPLPRGSWCSLSPDRSKLAYNRIFREFRTWKRYRGGQADDIWIYDFATRKTTNLTNSPAQEVFPMWSGKKIYFLSDRDPQKRFNLYVHDLETGATTPLTKFTEFDIKFPSLGDHAIIFENGGELYRTELASGQTEKIPILLEEDFAVGRGGIRNVSKSVTDYEIAPDGSRALFGARGDLFTVPAKYGSTRNLTATPGIHERNGVWSPDGRWIACVSDQTGEDEIWLVPQDGQGKPTQLTTGADTYKYRLVWSPDSKKILWADKKLRLQYVEVATRQVTLVDRASAWEFSDYAWSPDSRWIAYARPEEKQMTTLRLYALESAEKTNVTDGWFASYDPCFSADGRYLFFVSDRTFTPTYGRTEWNHVYNDLAKIYLVTLTRDGASPFAPKSDEVRLREESSRMQAAKNEKAGPPVLSVDTAGIRERIAAFPVASASYRNLQCAGDRLFYLRKGTRDEKTKLLVYELEKEKETELGEVEGFEISADGKKMLIGQSGSYALIDLPTSKLDMKDHLDLSGMEIHLDRRAEWTQIFHESWRQMRDFVYDPHLHGVDWPAIGKQYALLLPFVNHRTDLTYVIGEMIGEINLGHCYVGGGDVPKPERIPQGLLGAQLERDSISGAYRITRILTGENWDKAVRSPLTEIGVNVHQGDYILKVNGKPTREMNDIYAALVNTAGKQVTLTVNSAPSADGARDVTVVPIADEHPLYYHTWVEKNVETVSRATNGRVGYVHIPDMGAPGLNAFAEYYYPQLRKEALIVDVRGNGGGNVSPMIVERLRREVAMIDVARNAAIAPDPGGMVVGPKVMLIDEFSASDGDIVAYRFKKYHLGPVIGKRTWGGVVGIRGSLPFLDGGFLNKPEFSRYDTEGKEWIMEGHGVDPDIVVDNDPAREFAGIDDQLERAIEVIKEKLPEHPLPPPPPYPKK
jgi:tricorn protease